MPSRQATIVIIAVIVIIVAGVAAYAALLAGHKPAPTGTTAPARLELTGNLKQDLLHVAKILTSNGVHTVKYTVWGAGDPNSVMRTLGVVEAAYRLNKILRENGVDLKIVIQQRFERGGGNELFKEFLAAYEQKANPDIMANSYIHLAALASQGLLLDLTPYADKYTSLINDFYPALLDAVKWHGKIYAIPQDTEARPLYWRKDVAECIYRKTGVNILRDLAERVKEGEVTWSTVYHYAELAKKTGCAEWGMIHRKGTAHPDLIQFIYAFGGRLYDPKTGKLVLDVPAVYKWLSVEYAFARAGLTPKNMMSWDWAKQIHPTVVDGKTLVFIGGTWHWTEWQTKPYYTDPKTGKKRPLTPEEVAKYFYYTLFPAGEKGDKPVTLSQPFVWYIAANAGKDNPKYQQLREAYHALAFLLLVKASDPDINAIHSIISSHLPVRRAAAKLLRDKAWIDKLAKLEIPLSPEVKNAIAPIVKATVNPINIEFLANVSSYLEYTRLTPKHPYYGKLASIFADAVDKVLRGEMTPAKAVKYIIAQVKADPDLAKSVEIVGEIPANWKFPTS